MLLQMVVAYVAFELMLWVFIWLWAFLIAKPVGKVLFWIIDVIPSRGENAEEAKLILTVGPMIWLSKKFTNDIENWTDGDNEEFAKCMNWRARLLFNAKEKVSKRVKVMQEVYWSTGKQPAELGAAEVDKLLKPYKDNWFETAIIHPQVWNGIVGAVIIVIAILYMAPK
jgi:hypothetical protein